jgi:hypothetical protein
MPGQLATALVLIRAAAIDRAESREKRQRLMQDALEEASLTRDQERTDLLTPEPKAGA